jgi:hypothetical protein
MGPAAQAERWIMKVKAKVARLTRLLLVSVPAALLVVGCGGGPVGPTLLEAQREPGEARVDSRATEAPSAEELSKKAEKKAGRGFEHQASSSDTR